MEGYLWWKSTDLASDKMVILLYATSIQTPQENSGVMEQTALQ